MLWYLVLTLLQVYHIQAIPLPTGLISDYRNSTSRVNYVPVSTSTSSPSLVKVNPYLEQYSTVSVVTRTVSNGIAQIPHPPTTTPYEPSAVVHTEIETSGRSPPLNTSPIAEPTSFVDPGKCQTKTKSAMPLFSSTAASSNIFGAPIASQAPPATFKVHKDHPVPRLGVVGKKPAGTNKFYGNLYLGNQTSPAFVHPYSVSWARGKGATPSWGMSISHVDAKQRVYGEKQTSTGAVKYFVNPVGIQSLSLSAKELGGKTSLTTNNLAAQSVNVNLHASPEAKPMVTFPLVQGMGFVTAVYSSGTPIINTGVYFKTVTKSTKFSKPGVSKYSLHLEDGNVWHLYSYAHKGDSLDIKVINNACAEATRPFTGFIQVSKDPGDCESLLDQSAGAYPVSVSLSGTASGETGSYTFTFEKAGDANTKLLMYALPHHVTSFDEATAKAASKAKLQTTTKGIATGVVADSWTMVEPKMAIAMDFAPWDPADGPKKTLQDSAIQTISAVAVKELSQNIDQQANQNSMYFGGKALAKFAQICYTAHELLKNPDLASSGVKSLEAAFSRFSSNTQQFPLYYDSTWGGLVSSASYTTGNSGADFGNTYYNDHHFHYGYFVYAAAVIGQLDPAWMTKANIEFVNTMVRDFANPSTSDKYFPVSRNFDWYHGHSWAHGLYETLDGKDQESSSEDAMAAYAVKMWGKTAKDANMEARGNLMLSVISRSLNNYYLYSKDNDVQPSNFIGNKAAGILFENKCDHTTYFGSNIEYIQGIHMMPLLPSTKLTRPTNFVKEEWETYFDNGRADAIEGGWKGILFGNLATIDPQASWDFFTSKSFDPSWLDGGVSLTWYQAYAAAFMS